MTGQLASMTGYARQAGISANVSFTLDVKTVNARGLDIRLRLPSGLDALEGPLRQLVSQNLTRGTVTMSVNMSRSAAGNDVSINQGALSQLLALAEQLHAQKPDMKMPGIGELLSVQGIVEWRQETTSEDELKQLVADVTSAAETALAELVSVRKAEGNRLHAVLEEQLSEIERLTKRAEAHPARSPEAIRDKLSKQIEELLGPGSNFDAARLHQEAAMLATKADVREELDRLYAHIAAARELLEKGGAIGRRLDFLSQEFNREANTLCSKSNAVDLTAIGLELKAVIDQLREQVQNIE